MDKQILIKGLGEKLRSTRRERNLTQQQLGDLSDLSYKYVGEIERAEKNPSIDVLNRIADALKVDLLELLDLIPPKTGSKEEEAKETQIAKIEKVLKNLDLDQLEKVLRIARIISEK
ncbi:MAG: helix-turn-helix transcriptional regulator [Candidatus Pacebacteria bacterium]|nr:helix-turn-helix transcriptional regulator [Candidatus Paceibacterota bacterium]MDD5222460.1 helix-turn-helix transcriptional regulator [bacterium]